MKLPCAVALSLSFVSGSVTFAAQPSPQSIERLLTLTRAERMTEAITHQVSDMLKPMFDQAIESKSLTREQSQKGRRIQGRVFSEDAANKKAAEFKKNSRDRL